MSLVLRHIDTKNVFKKKDFEKERKQSQHCEKFRDRSEKCVFNIIKYHRPLSDAAYYARRLIRAYDICSAIRYLSEDDVTNAYLSVKGLSMNFSFFTLFSPVKLHTQFHTKKICTQSRSNRFRYKYQFVLSMQSALLSFALYSSFHY